MIIASLELYHSRAIAPTRRVSLGARSLATDTAPGPGGILLGGIAATYIGSVDPELHADLQRLTIELEDAPYIPQPRLRHRLQADKIGLSRSTLNLRRIDDEIRYDLTDVTASPLQATLGAVYAAGSIGNKSRRDVLSCVRRGLLWQGPIGQTMIANLAGGDTRSMSAGALENPIGWAMAVLDFAVDAAPPGRAKVKAAFRMHLRDAHPDHGAGESQAAKRIADLAEARRILLQAAAIAAEQAGT